jgi:RNA polymerase sigma-70 factor (family 1)
MPEKKRNLDNKLSDGGKLVFKDFFNNNYPAFCSLASRYIHNKQVCEDIVNDVFVMLWEKQNSFFNQLSAKAFCYKSIRNSCLDYIKHEKVEEKYLNNKAILNDKTEFFLDEVLKAEAYNTVYQEINKLPEKERKVILLALDEKTNEEIAAELGIAISTVKTHKGRAYRVLRKELAGIFILYYVLKK